jgi:CelD/BcsL family acetyltransferase involved in cellulose biosynthesis
VQQSGDGAGSIGERLGMLELKLADAGDLARICPRQWDELSDNALDPNPFYSRRYMAAGLSTIDRDTRLRALTVQSADGKLVGFFPFRLTRFPVQVAIGATNIYQMSGQPLLHRDYAADVIATWFDAMQAGRVPRRWRFPHVDLNSGFAELCGRQLQTARFDLTPLTRYQRARLRRLSGGFELHVKTVLSKSRAKDIQRTLRRLQEVGQVEFERATEPGHVRQRIEDFLVMEHGGWKGAAGTSFLSDPEHARFIREAMQANDAVTTDSLLLDGQPIAVSINLQAAGTMFTPKCAYDENYRRFSPGLLLEYLVIEAFYDRDDASEMDAATTADGHLVQGLWNDERAMGMVLLGPSDTQTRVAAQSYLAVAQARTLARSVGGDRLATVFRRLKRLNPELWQRLTSFGQGATCLLLYI